MLTEHTLVSVSTVDTMGTESDNDGHICLCQIEGPMYSFPS